MVELALPRLATVCIYVFTSYVRHVECCSCLVTSKTPPVTTQAYPMLQEYVMASRETQIMPKITSPVVGLGLVQH